MGHKFAETMFTQSVQALQAERGSRVGYAKMEQGDDFNQFISEHEAEFILQRDSFYMASVSETHWPYVQHRGGPKGFMQVLDSRTLGFADFSGNRQYVSAGNFRKNNRVALIFMDYPNKRRLKLIGHISEVDESDWETLAKLKVEGYGARVERGFLIKVEGFDWNCPRHITPRFSGEDVEKLIGPLLDENQFLKKQRDDVEAYPQISGKGPLPLVISGIRQLTSRVRAYELRHVHGLLLPEAEAGSYLSIPVKLSNGEWQVREYSIASNPARRDCYEIAVKLLEQGAGGSQVVHEAFQLGMELRVDYPANHFSLQSQQDSAVLIAGDIGITPIKAMAKKLARENIPFELHYAGKSESDMPYFDRLKKAYKYNFYGYASDQESRINFDQVLEASKAHTHIYVCGPTSLIDDVLERAQKKGIDQNRIHVERFTVPQSKASTT